MRATARGLRSSGWVAIGLLVALGAVAVAGTASDYGQSWDEPYFYDYADAVPYAYSLASRLKPGFDLERAYGPSATDHKVYGPAYLLLARPVVVGLQHLTNSDRASAWHAANALTFLVSVVLLFWLMRRWLSPWAAVAGSALYALQPMLWGHAFINPKDIPFLAFFLGSVALGLRMIDRLCESQAWPGPTDARARTEVANPGGRRLPANTKLRRWIGEHAPWLEPLPSLPSLLPPRPRMGAEIRAALLPGVILGLASCLRVLGPAAGLLVLLSFFLQSRRRSMLGISLYLLIAVLMTYLTWPYLWESPINRFWEVVQRSAQNPTTLAVLFQGGLYHSDTLPRIYFPLLLSATLTEPVLWMAFAGMVVGGALIVRGKIDWRTFVVIPVWFLAFLAYIVLVKPPMYDGIRHFLFILPPLFVFAGVAFEGAFAVIRSAWVRAIILSAVLLPGIYGILETHPYEYAYFNQFVGRLPGAFRQFETDYWLTCYKDAVGRLNDSVEGPATLYVFREPHIAEAYAAPRIRVRELDPEQFAPTAGDFLLLSSRTNEDRYFATQPAVIVVGKRGATFCVIRQVAETEPPTE